VFIEKGLGFAVVTKEPTRSSNPPRKFIAKVQIEAVALAALLGLGRVITRNKLAAIYREWSAAHPKKTAALIEEAATSVGVNQ